MFIRKCKKMVLMLRPSFFALRCSRHIKGNQKKYQKKKGNLKIKPSHSRDFSRKLDGYRSLNT